MKLKNVLIVVNDIEASKKFYKELFGLDIILDNDTNVILTEGLVLQEKKVWQECIEREISVEHHASELYFEETDIESFAKKLEKKYPNTKYLNKLIEYPWGQKMLRFYDLDGNLIEIRTPM